MCGVCETRGNWVVMRKIGETDQGHAMWANVFKRGFTEENATERLALLSELFPSQTFIARTFGLDLLKELEDDGNS